MITKRENKFKPVMQFVDMEILVPNDHLVRKIESAIEENIAYRMIFRIRFHRKCTTTKRSQRTIKEDIRIVNIFGEIFKEIINQVNSESLLNKETL